MPEIWEIVPPGQILYSATQACNCSLLFPSVYSEKQWRNQNFRCRKALCKAACETREGYRVHRQTVESLQGWATSASGGVIRGRGFPEWGRPWLQRGARNRDWIGISLPNIDQQVRASSRNGQFLYQNLARSEWVILRVYLEVHHWQVHRSHWDPYEKRQLASTETVPWLLPETSHESWDQATQRVQT